MAKTKTKNLKDDADLTDSTEITPAVDSASPPVQTVPPVEIEEDDFSDARLPFRNNRTYYIGRESNDRDYPEEVRFIKNPPPVVRAGSEFLDNDFSTFDDYIKANPDGFKPSAMVTMAVKNRQGELQRLGQRTMPNTVNSLNDDMNPQGRPNGNYKPNSLIMQNDQASKSLIEAKNEQIEYFKRLAEDTQRKLDDLRQKYIDKNLEAIEYKTELSNYKRDYSKTEKQNTALNDEIKVHKAKLEEQAKGLNDNVAGQALIGIIPDGIRAITEMIKPFLGNRGGMPQPMGDNNHLLTPEELEVQKQLDARKAARMAQYNQNNNLVNNPKAPVPNVTDTYDVQGVN